MSCKWNYPVYTVVTKGKGSITINLFNAAILGSSLPQKTSQCIKDVFPCVKTNLSVQRGTTHMQYKGTS